MLVNLTPGATLVKLIRHNQAHVDEQILVILLWINIGDKIAKGFNKRNI